MLGTACFPCCGGGDFTAGVALKGWGVNAHPANYSGWTQNYFPASQPNGVWANYTATGVYPLHSSTSVSAYLSYPAYNTSTNLARVHVAYLASEVEVRVTVARGNTSITANYRRPLAYWPTFQTAGIYQFDPSDVASYSTSNPYGDPYPIGQSDIGTVVIIIGYQTPSLGPCDYTMTFTAGTPYISDPPYSEYYWNGLQGTTLQVTHSGTGAPLQTTTASLCDPQPSQSWCGRSARITFDGSWITVRGYGWSRFIGSCSGACYSYTGAAVCPIAYPAWVAFGQPTGTLDTGTFAAVPHSQTFPGFTRSGALYHGTFRLVLTKL